MSNVHPETDCCGFDRNASISEDCYVCTCGYVDRDTPNPASLNANAGNNFCRACGCHFPPDNDEMACRAWEICCEAQSANAKLEMPRMDEILLACGEMTASERRCVRTALEWFIRRSENRKKNG